MGKWCLHASSFIFDRIIIKVASNQDRHKSSDKFDLCFFEIWPWHIGHRWAVVAIWAAGYYKPPRGFVLPNKISRNPVHFARMKVFMISIYLTGSDILSLVEVRRHQPETWSENCTSHIIEFPHRVSYLLKPHTEGMRPYIKLLLSFS